MVVVIDQRSFPEYWVIKARGRITILYNHQRLYFTKMYSFVFLVLVIGSLLPGCTPKVLLPGVIQAQAMLLPQVYVTSDNTRLPLRTWVPKGHAINSIVIAMHGFNDYAMFFDQTGQALQKLGIASFAFDQRGFGATKNRGIWSGSETMAQDLTEFIHLIKLKYPDIPIYVLGESMGGAVVMVAMTQKNAPTVNGLILSAPAIWGYNTMPWYQRWALTLGSYTFPWVTLTGRGLKIKASDNIPMLRKLGRDPLIIKETRIDAMFGLTKLMSLALESSKNLDDRALILYGELDEVIPKLPTFKMLKQRTDKAKKQQKVAVYSQGYHMLLRDLNADIPQQDIIAWIKNPRDNLPSGADQRPLEVLLD